MEDRDMQGYQSGTALALFAALGVSLGGAEASAQGAGCDADGNGYVSAEEAATCAERDYSALATDQEAISREQFEGAFAASENVDAMWADADTNQDGQLTQAEWSDWSARRFRSASPRVEGLSVDDYEALEAQYHMGDDQEGRDESVGAGGAPGSVGAEAGGPPDDDESTESGASSGRGSEGGGDGGDDEGSDGDSDASGDSDGDASEGDDDQGGDADAGDDSNGDGSDGGGSGGGSGG
jgi:hypothetical protein